MAIVNYENLPSENTPLTGGASGNLNVMQENGTTHGSDTKLGYSQAFLNDHLVNVSNEVDEDYRVNFLKGKNLINCNDFTSYSTTGVNVTTSKTDGLLDYINVTKSSSTSGNIFISICNFTLSKETGTYNLSGCPSGGGESTYQLYFKDETTTQDVYPRNDGTPASVSLTKGHNYTLYLRLNASATFTDKKFYPMLLPTTETDTSYEPYIVPSIYVDNEEIYSKDNLEQYSTSEIRIGTWINGKPLYRKILDITTNTAITQTIQHGIANLNEAIRSDVKLNISGKSCINPVNPSNNQYCTIWSVSSNEILLLHSDGFNSLSGKIILEYTKTTD